MNWELLVSPETADRAAATLLHSFWQGALLAAAAATVCRLGRRLSVASHYLVYATALAACAATLPVTYWMLDAESNRISAVSRTALPAGPMKMTTDVAVGATTNSEQETLVRRPPHPIARPVPPATATARSISVTWQRAIPWLLALYIVGVAGMLVRLALGVIGAERLRRAAEPASDGPAARALELARRRWPFQAAPLVAYSARVAVPALVGLLQPTILLPVRRRPG